MDFPAACGGEVHCTPKSDVGYNDSDQQTEGAVHRSVYLSIGIIAALIVVSYLKNKRYRLDV